MTVPLAEGRSRPGILQRRTQRSLVALSEARQRALFGMRVARVLGIAMALGTLIAMFVLSASRGRDVLDALTVRALAWLSWIVGSLAALSAAQNLEALDERDGIVALALLRGQSRRALGAARVAASVQAITRLVGVPALIVCLGALGLSSHALLAPRLLLLLGVIGYVAGLGLVLGLLARWAVATSPTRGRAVLATVVLGPELVRAVWSDMPSIVAAFSWLLDRLLATGGAA